MEGQKVDGVGRRYVRLSISPEKALLASTEVGVKFLDLVGAVKLFLRGPLLLCIALVLDEELRPPSRAPLGTDLFYLVLSECRWGLPVSRPLPARA
uniref:Uncharacterized protein n=1 Tax=Chromera velia CCMP2878 TaxID=1169474 RepID=A0A0G4G2K1_9ALVE|eukprot:Cvel_19936.t1-p1 / transcript=Cvel_19936.t1 / gene=Cvel_19936 / organism=Chromera_velia_CCMP2878 / gene_product=Chromobox protein homolog 5, putative / transcript_product=Chromobox protein homolog 5, putative / location=Cvel_scaffold1754:15500-17696(-) / protein_length=95 / sequence_SO=supercontig / SO=protein_coding / is_pseudo=false